MRPITLLNYVLAKSTTKRTDGVRAIMQLYRDGKVHDKIGRTLSFLRIRVAARGVVVVAMTTNWTRDDVTISTTTAGSPEGGGGGGVSWRSALILSAFVFIIVGTVIGNSLVCDRPPALVRRGRCAPVRRLTRSSVPPSPSSAVSARRPTCSSCRWPSPISSSRALSWVWPPSTRYAVITISKC